MIRILCNDIQQQCSFPGRKGLSKIAERIVGKYSESFCDAVGDTIVGTGFESLRKQMEDRLNNVNRKGTKPRSLTLRSSDEDSDQPKSKRGKNLIRDSYGCINWQPESFPESETEESQIEKQHWLIAEFPKKEVDKAKVALLMKQTYAFQRLLINKCKPNPPEVTEIKDQWPFLFASVNMLSHFEQLMGFKLEVVLQESLNLKASVVYNYMKQEHLQKKRVKETLLKIDTAMSVENSKVPQMIGIYLLLLAYFGEQEDFMIQCFDESATEDDVMLDKIPTTPFIAIFGDMFVAKRCGLVIDRLMVNLSPDGIAQGMTMLFASYFVLNIVYPNELAATLEFIQRCLVNLNPDKGNKRAKTKGKQHNVNPKVLSLANALKDYQNQWVL